MFDIVSEIGAGTSALAVAVSVFSAWYQRRQTQIMQIALDRALDSDVSDGESRSKFERNFRALLNKRLSDVRVKLRQDFKDEIDKVLRTQPMVEYSNSMLNISNLIRDQAVITDLAQDSDRTKAEITGMRDQIVAETGRYASDIEAHGRDIEVLQQRLEALRVRLNYLDMIRGQIQQIGQQLVQMTSQQD